MKNLTIQMQGSHLSGALLVSGNSSQTVSTIGCGIKFPNDGAIFALTVGHPFEDFRGITKLKGTVDEPSPPHEDDEKGKACRIAAVELSRVWGPTREEKREYMTWGLYLDWALIEISTTEQWEALNPSPVIRRSAYDKSNQSVRIKTPRGVIHGTIEAGHPEIHEIWKVEYSGKNSLLSYQYVY